MPSTHVLKSWQRFYRPILDGRRTHELRRNDRGFKVGDFLELREYDEMREAFTGRSCIAEVTSITSKEEPCAVSELGLNPDFCILSISVVSSSHGS